MNQEFMLRPLMHHLERRLHAPDVDAYVRHPFEFGLVFIYAGHKSNLNSGRQSDHSSESPRQFIQRFNDEAIAQSDRFFTPPPCRQSDFELLADFEFSAPDSGFHRLTFPSAINMPYEKNNWVHARLF